MSRSVTVKIKKAWQVMEQSRRTYDKKCTKRDTCQKSETVRNDIHILRSVTIKKDAYKKA